MYIRLVFPDDFGSYNNYLKATKEVGWLLNATKEVSRFHKSGEREASLGRRKNNLRKQ